MRCKNACLLLAALVFGCLLTWQPAQAQGERSNRSPHDKRLPRPRHESPRVEKLPPELERILKEWEASSGKIKKLYGSHRRYVYDSVFQVELRAEGHFWFEAPDKGRIDIKPSPVEPGQTNPKKRGPDGRPYTVKPDTPEQWVSNGTEIQRVNHSDKTIEVFPIPKEMQGKNIVEGPLPFLFGMKAERVKQRYKLRLGERHGTIMQINKVPTRVVHIKAEPRLRRDAANWSKADVVLDWKTYYPAAIKLLDPAGTKETVYSFSKVHEPSGLEEFFKGNPFRLYLPGYNRVVHQAGEQEPDNRDLSRMPVVRGRSDWQALKDFFEQRGYTVKVEKGRAAPRSGLENTIYQQQPEANRPLTKGQTIVFTIYRSSSDSAPAGGTLAAARMPDLLGRSDWQTIRKFFERRGFEIKFRRGVPAPKPELVYHVYQQDPKPNALLQKGQTVVLTLYDKMAGSSKRRTNRSSAKPAPSSRQ